MTIAINFGYSHPRLEKENEIVENNFGMIPNHLIDSSYSKKKHFPALDATSKVLLQNLKELPLKWKLIKEVMADKVGCSVYKLDRCIKNLVEKGYLRIIRFVNEFNNTFLGFIYQVSIFAKFVKDNEQLQRDENGKLIRTFHTIKINPEIFENSDSFPVFDFPVLGNLKQDHTIDINKEKKKNHDHSITIVSSKKKGNLVSKSKNENDFLKSNSSLKKEKVEKKQLTEEEEDLKALEELRERFKSAYENKSFDKEAKVNEKVEIYKQKEKSEEKQILDKIRNLVNIAGEKMNCNLNRALNYIRSGNKSYINQLIDWFPHYTDKNGNAVKEGYFFKLLELGHAEPPAGFIAQNKKIVQKTIESTLQEVALLFGLDIDLVGKLAIKSHLKQKGIHENLKELLTEKDIRKGLAKGRQLLSNVNLTFDDFFDNESLRYLRNELNLKV